MLNTLPERFKMGHYEKRSPGTEVGCNQAVLLGSNSGEQTTKRTVMFISLTLVIRLSRRYCKEK